MLGLEFWDLQGIALVLLPFWLSLLLFLRWLWAEAALGAHFLSAQSRRGAGLEKHLEHKKCLRAGDAEFIKCMVFPTFCHFGAIFGPLLSSHLGAAAHRQLCLAGTCSSMGKASVAPWGDAFQMGLARYRSD